MRESRAKVRVRPFPLSAPERASADDGTRWFGTNSVAMPTAGTVVPGIENFVEGFQTD
jgi:hypothetical protein